MRKGFSIQLTAAVGVLTAFLCFSASAQSSANLYWIRYFNQLHFNTKWSWQNEFDERRSIQPDQQRQFIMHSYANFNLKSRTEFSAGMTGSWVTNLSNLTVPEVRTFQSITSRLATIDKFEINFRFRLEERFFITQILKGST
ncbi:MAG: DUF2490 domain-containing protein [Bacteroidota bacterium]